MHQSARVPIAHVTCGRLAVIRRHRLGLLVAAAPLAARISGVAGNPGKVPCVPDPNAHDCVKPYLNTSDINSGGPHMYSDAGLPSTCDDGPTPFSLTPVTFDIDVKGSIIEMEARVR
jgi:hypothetical protein